MFFQEIFKNAHGCVELRFIHPNKSIRRYSVDLGGAESWEKIDRLVEYYDTKAHCYFSLCPRNTPEGKEIHDVSGISVLWADIDAHGRPKSEAWEQVQKLDPLPSVLVDSGGGYHAYWLLDDFYPTPDDETRDDAAAIERGLTRHMGGDMAATDLARIFRVPGTMNIKPETMRKAEIISWHPDIRYPVSVFQGMAEKSGRKLSVTNRQEIYQFPLPALNKAMHGCEFFGWCLDHAEHIPEPLWYALITSLIRYEGGEVMIHQISSEDPRYKAVETQKKILHAIRAGYPHSCQYLVNSGWGFECSKLRTCKALTPGRYAKKGNT
ncbi:hypothetical protein CEB3_c18800 [Peptococcaceae bacterium CEB3]|nr:hypothetical protein CEB3_c18800 [Peptococcaceae bacterium CEB3]